MKPTITTCLALLCLGMVITACQLTLPGNTPTPANSPAIVTTTPLQTSPADDLSTMEASTPNVSTPDSLASSTPTPDEALPAPHYSLDATLNYANHDVSVVEEILYTNRSGERLDELVLLIEPVNYPGTFTLENLLINSTQPGESGWEQNILRLRLSQPLMPAETAQISITYTLNLPSPIPSADTRPVPFGYTANQTNLVDWYPMVAPYIPGKGWLAHTPFFYGEHLVYETSDFNVTLTIQDERQDLVIAASALDEPDGNTHRYQLMQARSFAFSISHNFQVFSEKAGDITVLSYVFPAHARAGQQALKTTIEALQLYQDLFGAYSHASLSVVEADFLDGMEYDGLYFLSNGFYNLYQGTQAEYLVAIAAHETSHQWWYGLVGNDQALEPWLDEALCTYSEKIFYERLHPDALDWWWTYRVNYYEPQGWVDTSIYNPEGVPQAYRYYRGAVYLNGAHFLNDLRALIGEEAFFSFLRAYARKYMHAIATKNDFFSVLQQHSSQDLSALLIRYFKNH